MSGPALKKLNSHHSIHEGVLSEAREATNLLSKLIEENKEKKHILEVCDALIEHWETRVLAHAKAEEEGLFPESIEKNEASIETITMLKRDHQLLNFLIEEIKEEFANKHVNEYIMNRFNALLCILSIHNREEEKHILHDH